MSGPFDLMSCQVRCTEPDQLHATPLQMRRIDGPRSPDATHLVSLVLNNPRYRFETQHRPPCARDATDLLCELPMGATPQQKYVWGLWVDGCLMGCLEVLRGWPHAHHLYIGQLLIAEAYQRRGYGLRTLQMLAERSRGWAKIHRWRLAVVESQLAARAFWKSAGFAETGQRSRLPQYHEPLVLMEKPVGR